jgi:hypothetical protein
MRNQETDALRMLRTTASMLSVSAVPVVAEAAGAPVGADACDDRGDLESRPSWLPSSSDDPSWLHQTNVTSCLNMWTLRALALTRPGRETHSAPHQEPGPVMYSMHRRALALRCNHSLQAVLGLHCPLLRTCSPGATPAGCALTQPGCPCRRWPQEPERLLWWRVHHLHMLAATLG